MRWRYAGKLAVLAALFTPPTIMLHELGHFAVALASGLPAELHAASVSGGADEGSPAAAWLEALQAGAGPLVTLAMGIGATLLFRRDPRRLWALAFATAAISRLAVTTVWLGVRLGLLILGRPYGASPNFDEHNVATILGLPPILLALTATACLAALLWALLAKVPRGSRLAALGAMSAAIVAANVAWPAIMPDVIVRS